ncbi:MAG: hypothetical protein ACK54F_03700 [Planctomycetia bacterium]
MVLNDLSINMVNFALYPSKSLNGIDVVFCLLELNTVQLSIHLSGPKANDADQQQQKTADNREEHIHKLHYKPE